MKDEPIACFSIPELSSLPDDIREKIEAVHEKAGFIPNIFLLLARRPLEFRAFFDYHDALMLRENDELTTAEREMIVVASSAANDCHYCVIAHGALLRIYAKDSFIADRIAINHGKAGLDERQRKMLDFAVKVAVDSQSIDEDDREQLRKCGFSDESIWDIGNIAAFFALSNRLASVADLMPNREFYMLGRRAD